MPEPGEALKEQFQNALEPIGAAAQFAGFGDLPQMPPPDLMVKDIGIVGLPLCNAQAKELIQKSHQAPFGKGSDTIIDTSVRKTWEINADQLEFRRPGNAWDSFVQGLEKRIRTELDLTANVRAELYKLLIYEEGAMFKPHVE